LELPRSELAVDPECVRLKLNDTVQNFFIRSFRSGDESALYCVCLQTGDAGRDATALYDDPLLLGHLYVGPYLALEPDLAFVLEDATGVCGYTLGARDSRVFYERLRREWLPPLQAQHPVPREPRDTWSQSDRIRSQFHTPEIFWPEPSAEFPAHLHIDLLPRAQGQGNGRRMMAALLERLRQFDVPGVHLSMHVTNQRAGQFYARLGFRELARRGETMYLGIPLQ
jgi:ribosomal protein S18 acetylase RimI-like enzyme